jgi:RimJ/RimL family protein N-acetyltransferase
MRPSLLREDGFAMDRSRYALRPFQDTDYDKVASLNLAIDPVHPEPAESARRWHDVITREPGRIIVKWVVEELPSGSMVGWGGLMHTLDTYHPRKFLCRAGVHPEHRRRGIGEALHDAIEREALGRGAVCLWSVVRGDDLPSLRFQERHGFAPTRMKWESRLDLTQFNPSRFPDRSQVLLDRGIRITTLAAEGAERPEVLRRFYDLWTITVEEEPRMGDYYPISFNAFLETVIRGPKVLPDATFLAQQGEKYVGSSSLERDLSVPDNIEVGFTGTLSEFRGLGIASELKRDAVTYAHTHGYHSVTTGNDSLNPRIWAINEKLGFRRERTWVEGERLLRLATA